MKKLKIINKLIYSPTAKIRTDTFVVLDCVVIFFLRALWITLTKRMNVILASINGKCPEMHTYNA
jgi:hypothetical protein